MSATLYTVIQVGVQIELSEDLFFNIFLYQRDGKCQGPKYHTVFQSVEVLSYKESALILLHQGKT